MITPSFSCLQSHSSLIVSIYVPAVRASDVEIHAEDTLLSVHISPYFLRLSLPGRVLEDDASSARYDPASGYLTVTLTKEVPGEDFKDLDILAKLLAPKRIDPSNQPVIEVLASKAVQDANNREAELIHATERLTLERREVLEAAENDWRIPQQVPETLPALQTSSERRYGFLNMYTGYFRHVIHTANEINDLGPDAETMSEQERRVKRLRREDEKWDEEYYMADYADDEVIQEHIAYQRPAQPSDDEPFQFTEDENITMLHLPKKEYLASPIQAHNLYLLLISILFSSAYDARTTQHEPTPESAWTICALTPAFSALDPPPYSPAPAEPPVQFTQEELHATLLAYVRRTLAFPLYRSITLAAACIADVAALLHRGRRAVLRVLLSTKRILDTHEVYYVYSKIWVDDLCGWVARDASDDTLIDIGQKLNDIQIDKQRIGWDVLALEEAVDSHGDRESDSDDED